jgi:hypothetical protein
MYLNSVNVMVRRRFVCMVSRTRGGEEDAGVILADVLQWSGGATEGLGLDSVSHHQMLKILLAIAFDLSSCSNAQYTASTGSVERISVL